ncbi:glutathione S-transferase-like isoform X2 [Lolium rigidum]|uniref:glutathione S-transferase-like isoform X2 n=1 Tax=Lolium rigidum TaxID=89674 RepID=UPI001F5D4B38|nr:glutathione S-transferase-like isoform X2 [Lolium rigidum]
MSATGKPILYSKWFSSCSQRVRIALNLKGVDFEYRATNPMTDPDYEKINPVKFVPALVDGDLVVSDSFAIILYMEDKYPQHPLLSQDLKNKALNLQIASIVCSSIQPLQSHAVIFYMIFCRVHFLAQWTLTRASRWFSSILTKASEGDVFIAPQIHAGVTRFQIDMSKYPILARLQAAYNEHPAFQAALPKNQPDAPPSQ